MKRIWLWRVGLHRLVLLRRVELSRHRADDRRRRTPRSSGSRTSTSHVDLLLAVGPAPVAGRHDEAARVGVEDGGQDAADGNLLEPVLDEAEAGLARHGAAGHRQQDEAHADDDGKGRDAKHPPVLDPVHGRHHPQPGGSVGLLVESAQGPLGAHEGRGGEVVPEELVDPGGRVGRGGQLLPLEPEAHALPGGEVDDGVRVVAALEDGLQGRDGHDGAGEVHAGGGRVEGGGAKDVVHGGAQEVQLGGLGGADVGEAPEGRVDDAPDGLELGEGEGPALDAPERHVFLAPVPLLPDLLDDQVVDAVAGAVVEHGDPLDRGLDGRGAGVQGGTPFAAVFKEVWRAAVHPLGNAAEEVASDVGVVQQCRGIQRRSLANEF